MSDNITRILEIRQRNNFPATTVGIRTTYLKLALDKVDPELVRYFPISMVTCMEFFFRMLIQELIDHGSPYSDRAEKLKLKSKLDISHLLAVHGKKISAGEFVAYMVNLNNFADINEHMNILLGPEFVNKLAQINDRAGHELTGKPLAPIVDDIDRVLTSVQDVFKNRHILCHELALNWHFEKSAIKAWLDDIELFLEASAELVAEERHPNYPLTQAAMNELSGNQYQEAMDELKKLEEQIENLLAARGSEIVDSFHQAQQCFQEFCKLDAILHTAMYEGGTIAPLIANTAAEYLVRERIKDLQVFYNEHNPSNRK